MSCSSHNGELREVVKLVMILSKGNARVESRFSVIEDVLIENMSEGSPAAQRMVFDGVMNEGGISNVDINRKMLKFINNAHSEYVKQLEKRKNNKILVRKEAEKMRNYKWTEEGKGSKAEVYRTT